MFVEKLVDMASVICRGCSASVNAAHSLALFSEGSIKIDIAGRLSRLAQVLVQKDDELSNYICRSCKTKFLSLESKLLEFRALFKSSSSPLQVAPHSRKRVKDSGGIGVSPITAKARPHTKRAAINRELFPSQTNCPKTDSVLNSSNDMQPSQELQCLTTSTVTELAQPQASSTLSAPSVETNTPCLPLSLSEHSFFKETIGTGNRKQAPCSVKIIVSLPSETHDFIKTLDESLVKIGSTLASGNLSSFVKAIFSHPQLLALVTERYVGIVQTESSRICRRTYPNAFRKLPIENVEDFSWNECLAELKKTCPILLQLVQSIVSANDSRNAHNDVKQKKKSLDHSPGICTAVSILLKERNREMCGIQSYVGLVLFSSHVQKKVYTRLNHLCLTISYKQVISMVDKLSKRNGVPLKKWIDERHTFKFVGDNVDRKKVARDIRSDNRSKLIHMFSVFAVKDRIKPCTSFF